jgi:hypothetical protein
VRVGAAFRIGPTACLCLSLSLASLDVAAKCVSLPSASAKMVLESCQGIRVAATQSLVKREYSEVAELHHHPHAEFDGTLVSGRVATWEIGTHEDEKFRAEYKRALNREYVTLAVDGQAKEICPRVLPAEVSVRLVQHYCDTIPHARGACIIPWSSAVIERIEPPKAAPKK